MNLMFDLNQWQLIGTLAGMDGIKNKCCAVWEPFQWLYLVFSIFFIVKTKKNWKFYSTYKSIMSLILQIGITERSARSHTIILIDRSEETKSLMDG